jgi:tetratricopeptide (TPR) repeat protein
MAHNGLGLALDARGELDDAIEENKERYEHAIAECKDALRLNPGNVNARDVLKEASELDEKS